VFRPNLTNLTDEWEVIRRFYARNKRIAEEADVIYAFVAPDRRGGTENTIKWAKQLNKKVILRN
jgi:predicted Rossmann fold nucleotide-binding protein DprA/Smf involved in DNA uptake